MSHRLRFPAKCPAIIGTVTTAAGLRLLTRRQLPADAVEVRVDSLLAEGVAPNDILAALRQRRQAVLLTLRITAEGGYRSWKIKERRELYLRFLPEVEAVDVELATVPAMQPVLDEARRLGLTLVLSAHALQRPAPARQVERWIAQFTHQPRTILKIAALIHSWRDLQQLAALLVNHPDWSVAVMGLGPHAAQSRSVLAALGSRLVYGYLDRPAAPGQPSATQVRQMMKALQPPYPRARA